MRNQTGRGGAHRKRMTGHGGGARRRRWHLRHQMTGLTAKNVHAGSLRRHARNVHLENLSRRDRHTGRRWSRASERLRTRSGQKRDRRRMARHRNAWRVSDGMRTMMIMMMLLLMRMMLLLLVVVTQDSMLRRCGDGRRRGRTQRRRHYVLGNSNWSSCWLRGERKEGI